MRYGEIPGLNKPVARIVQGSTMIGSDLDEARTFALLDQVYELGCNTIDTAHVYSGGNSERLIGRWMQTRGLRDKIVIDESNKRCGWKYFFQETKIVVEVDD